MQVDPLPDSSVGPQPAVRPRNALGKHIRAQRCTRLHHRIEHATHCAPIAEFGELVRPDTEYNPGQAPQDLLAHFVAVPGRRAAVIGRAIALLSRFRQDPPLAGGKGMNSVGLEFEEGFTIVFSGNALRRV